MKSQISIEGSPEPFAPRASPRYNALMPRVLLLTTDLQIGGTPTVVRELALRLRPFAPGSIEVACLAPPGPVSQQIEQGGVITHALHAAGPRDLGVILRLHRLIAQRRYDKVFSFLVHANVAAAMVRPAHRGVRFLQSIQTTQPSPRWHWAAQRLAATQAQDVVVPSPSVARIARQWSGIPASRLLVIPNAVEPGEFSGLANAPRLPFRVGFIGRLDPIKRIGDLLRAAALLREHVELHIFGEGPERPALIAEIRRLDLQTRVNLHGAIARPQQALAEIDVLVLPSQAEGFGLVLIEAMAAGIPIVATNVPGIRDVVEHGRTGLLVRARAPTDLAAAIQRVMLDSSLRRTLVANAAVEVRRKFTWDVVLPMYRSLLGLGFACPNPEP